MYPSSLWGKTVLVTAGPTQEAIDPVRFISNHSSGKMGYAIVRALLQQGASVYLISGPVNITVPAHPRLAVQCVQTAMEMYEACSSLFNMVDIAVFAAAVADYRPAQVAKQKIKKSSASFTIKMVRNKDIAASFGKTKRQDQLSIGFALETNDEQENAIAKLERKNFDMVVLNSMNDANAGFGYDTNKISIINRQHTCMQFPLQDKQKVAENIVTAIIDTLAHKADQAMESSVHEYENLYR